MGFRVQRLGFEVLGFSPAVLVQPNVGRLDALA